MAEPRRTLLGAALDYRQALVRRDDATLARLAASWRSTSRDLEAEARRVFARIAEARLAGEPVTAAWLYRERRAAQLLEQIAEALDAYAAEARSVILRDAVVAVRASADDALALARVAGAPVDDRTWSWFAQSASEQALAHAQVVVPELVAGLNAAARVAAEDALIRAVVMGHNPRKAAASLADALDVARRRALVIARTEILRAYRETSRVAWQSSRVVEGWVWVSKLDRRTCAACWAMHGTLHRVDELMATHPQCRCVPAPRTVDWGAIDPALRGVADSRLEVPRGVDVFATLPDSEQRRLLGANYAAYAEGRIGLEDVVRGTHHPVYGPGMRVAGREWARAAAQRRRLGFAAPFTYPA